MSEQAEVACVSVQCIAECPQPDFPCRPAEHWEGEPGALEQFGQIAVSRAVQQAEHGHVLLIRLEITASVRAEAHTSAGSE